MLEKQVHLVARTLLLSGRSSFAAFCHHYEVQFYFKIPNLEIREQMLTIFLLQDPDFFVKTAFRLHCVHMSY